MQGGLRPDVVVVVDVADVATALPAHAGLVHMEPWTGGGGGDDDGRVRASVTADDVEEATFRTAALGYRRRDVDALLRAVVAELRASPGHGAAAAGGADHAERLAGALEAADRIRHDAERDARAIIHTAIEAAQAIVVSARRSFEETEAAAAELLERAAARSREVGRHALECQRMLTELSTATGASARSELSHRLEAAASDLLATAGEGPRPLSLEPPADGTDYAGDEE